MGFSALLERENFFEIMQKTLTRYFLDAGVSNFKLSYKPEKNVCEFILVPRLGMIMQPYPNKAIRKHYYADYNIRDNWVRNIVAKTAVFIATHTKCLLSMRQRMYVQPSDVINDSTVFAVCNRSIRIFDYKNLVTTSIQKQGFTDKYFVNQLKYRLNHKYEFIPPIIANGNYWFQEPLINGRALARETDIEKYKQAEREALVCMQTIAKDSLEECEAQIYCTELIIRLQALSQRTKETKTISTAELEKKLLLNVTQYLKRVRGTLMTAITHGDLQAGNIYIDNDGKTWVLDWETQERRSAWFDAATLLFATRYDGGIKKLIEGGNEPESTMKKLCSVSPCSLKLNEMILIYVAEDLVFNYEDMLELPDNGGSASFDRYINELSAIDWAGFFRGFN